jgi:uncharacterized protein (TIGR02246 family)
MRKFGWAAAAVILVLGSISLAFARPQDAMDADSAEAAKVANAYVDAFNSHDPHALAMLFTDNGDFVNGRGGSFHGRQAIETFFSKPFGAGGNLSGAHRTLTVKSAETVSPGVVSVYAMSDQTGSKAADGTVNPPSSTFFVFVLAKQGGHWGIAVFHESNLPKPN